MTPSLPPPAKLSHCRAILMSRDAGERRNAELDLKQRAAKFSSSGRRNAKGRSARSVLPLCSKSKARTARAFRSPDGERASRRDGSAATAHRTRTSLLPGQRFCRRAGRSVRTGPRLPRPVPENSASDPGPTWRSASPPCPPPQQAAKAVPFRFVLPRPAGRDFTDGSSLHCLERRDDNGHDIDSRA